MKQIFVLLTLFLQIFCQNEDVTCSEEFCKKYLQDNKCIPLPERCSIQNETHNGLILPYPGPCNCCEYCLDNLRLNEQCAIGNPSSPTPTSICGNSLGCDSTTGPSCQIIKTACTKAQLSYDEKVISGEIGHLEVRPECDKDGFYQPFSCVPGEICYCLSKDGERIFGEIPYTTGVEMLLHCECSRKYYEGKSFLNIDIHPSEHMRCQVNGDYDKVQCIGNGCLCVDQLDGTPTYKDAALVNMSLITNETLPCLNGQNYTEGEYYKQCEEIYIKQINEIKELEKNNLEVIGIVYPNCQLDGNYAPVQKNSKTKYCTDPEGNLLEDYSVDLTDELANTMDCKCARARSLITTDSKPTCCKNGNYAAMQCRRGLCRCVDSDGVQTIKEVDYSERTKLPCYNKCTPIPNEEQ